jgi:hypothetical protein
MTEDSQLYKAPTPPKGLARQEADDYTRGYRCGWVDQGEDRQWILDGNGDLSEVIVPASLYVEKESEIFKLGYAGGRERAREDLKTYEAQIREEMKAQNKPLARTPEGRRSG